MFFASRGVIDEVECGDIGDAVRCAVALCKAHIVLGLTRVAAKAEKFFDDVVHDVPHEWLSIRIVS